MALHIVILAAGLGKRMRSTTPKVLHCVAGRTLLERVIDVAQTQNPEQIHVIIGHQAQTIQSACQALPVNWVIQACQLGTGHSLLQALPHIPADAEVLVLYGDVPLLRAKTLENLKQMANTQPQGLTLLVATVPNPSGLGRIIRDAADQVIAIIEEKDATTAQRDIREIYSGICLTSANNLHRWLPRITAHNAQQEYYLTDIIEMATAEQRPICAVVADDYEEILGVNDCLQLQQVERILQYRTAQSLLLSGVVMADAKRIDIRGTLHCDPDVFIDINTLFEGQVSIGSGSVIGPNCVLKNVSIGARCSIEAASILENCTIGDDCQIGPFARIRPGTHLAAHCKIGNFVETKQAVFGEYSKANHLSYLGDVSIGTHVNIGAGTITCNYDGANKHQTIIEDGVHIGSDTQLVAPVTIGKNATIGAGSTIRSDAPAEQLTLTVTEQKTITGWARKQKL